MLFDLHKARIQGCLTMFLSVIRNIYYDVYSPEAGVPQGIIFPYKGFPRIMASINISTWHTKCFILYE